MLTSDNNSGKFVPVLNKKIEFVKLGFGIKYYPPRPYNKRYNKKNASKNIYKINNM